MLPHLVALRLPTMILAFSGAKLSKVLYGTWYSLGEQFHLDSAERLSAKCDVEETDRIW